MRILLQSKQRLLQKAALFGKMQAIRFSHGFEFLDLKVHLMNTHFNHILFGDYQYQVLAEEKNSF